jgi:hypothetical protein
MNASTDSRWASRELYSWSRPTSPKKRNPDDRPSDARQPGIGRDRHSRRVGGGRVCSPQALLRTKCILCRDWVGSP